MAHVSYPGLFPFCVLRGKVWQGDWEVAPVLPDDTVGYAQKILADWNDGSWTGSSGAYSWTPDPDPSDTTGVKKLNGLLIGDGTGWVGPMTLDQAMCIYWRVRSWTLAVSGASGSASVKNVGIYHMFIERTATLSAGSTDIALPSGYPAADSPAFLVCGSGGVHLKQVTGVGSANDSAWAGGEADYEGTISTAWAWASGSVSGGNSVATDVDNPDDYYVYIPISFYAHAHSECRFEGIYDVHLISTNDTFFTNEYSYGIFIPQYTPDGGGDSADAFWIVSPNTHTISHTGLYGGLTINANYSISVSNGLTIDLGGSSGTLSVSTQVIKTDGIENQYMFSGLADATTSSSIGSATLTATEFWTY